MSAGLAYRNIRYARAERFGPAEPVPLDGVAEGRERGPVPPQNPSRFDTLLGPPAQLAQAEDCQVLSVFTPDTSGSRPVMIWFHGGAFITGGGELPWYEGGLLAAQEDVVVVSVTARLGVLGYLSLYDPAGPSPAMTDQMAAIEWVRRHIHEFGGDPDRLTLFGQSAGAFAIEVMLRWGLPPAVQGAILQSGFIKWDTIVFTAEDVARQIDEFGSLIGRDPRSASVPEILAAQSEYARWVGRAEAWAPVRPEVEQPLGIPVIAGLTREDTMPYILMEQGIEEPRPEDFERFAEEIEERNRAEIGRGNLETLDEVVANGCSGWLYEFDWDVPRSGWGSPHCIELPFVLGDRVAWRRAPILDGADWDELEGRGRYVRRRWAEFATAGSPGAGWDAYDSSQRPVNSFSECAPEGL